MDIGAKSEALVIGLELTVMVLMVLELTVLAGCLLPQLPSLSSPPLCSCQALGGRYARLRFELHQTGLGSFWLGRTVSGNCTSWHARAWLRQKA